VWAGFPPWLAQGGLPTLAVVAVLAGYLVPRYLVTQMRKDLLPWRATAETAMATNAELAENLGRVTTLVQELIEAQKDTEALVRTLVATAATRRDGA
jgi:hypothetical protein